MQFVLLKFPYANYINDNIFTNSWSFFFYFSTFYICIFVCFLYLWKISTLKYAFHYINNIKITAPRELFHFRLQKKSSIAGELGVLFVFRRFETAVLRKNFHLSCYIFRLIEASPVVVDNDDRDICTHIDSLEEWGKVGPTDAVLSAANNID